MRKADVDESMQYLSAVTALALSALVAHQIFRTRETYSIVIHSILLFLPPFASYYVAQRLHDAHLSSLGSCSTVYFTTMGISVVLYRLSPYHPLARYPGPLRYKISKFVWAIGTFGGYSHYRLRKLHEKYGDVVRIGPNELSVRDSSAIGTVFGAPGVPKSPSYAGGTLGSSTKDVNMMMIGVMDFEEHMGRRRAWNRAFSTSAVTEYKEFIASRARLLIEGLEQEVGDVSLGHWFNNFSYDFMCDMTFGGGSDLLRGSIQNNPWSAIEQGVVVGNFFSHIPWLGVHIGRIPGAAGPLNHLMAHGRRLASERIRRGSSTRDLFHYLSNEDLPNKPPPLTKQLVDDGILAMIAGADTTSSAMTSIFFCLATNPDAYAALQAEVDRHFSIGEDPLTIGDYRELHYLNAVINEALRLFPPVLNGGPRKVPPHWGAVTAGSMVIPPGTTFWIPSYSLHRDARNFCYPDTFWPERWLVASGHLSLNDAHRCRPKDKDEDKGSLSGELRFVHNEPAFIPFSYGPMNCAGKNLALLQLRMVVCALVQKFHVTLREGWDAGEFGKGFKDYFVASKPELPVLLQARY